MEHASPPPLLVLATAVTGIFTALLLWFWAAGWGVSPASLAKALDAARVNPLVLLWVLHHFLLVATAAVWSVLDGAARRTRRIDRAAWATAILLLGVLGVWAYVARRTTPPNRDAGDSLR